MASLKRLSGAKEVQQDDISQGVGTFVVVYPELPKVKIADIKKEVGKYQIVKVGLKVTATVADNKIGAIALANPKDEDLLKEVAANGGKKLVVSGTLTEDDKGAQTLTLSKVAVAQ
jgi:hypothetical protein